MTNSIWKRRCEELTTTNLRRDLTITTEHDMAMDRDGTRAIVFCSNDYLGMRMHPSLKRAALRCLAEMGVGAGASRLVSGNTPLHCEVESAFATFVEKESAVLFPSGYQANVGAISALTDAGDIIFSDELAHASIIDGCRMSKAKVVVYPHNDVHALFGLMKTHNDCEGIKLVITEGVFSMDGDLPPLEALCDTVEEAGGTLYLDEAHSLGIFGTRGQGLAHERGVLDRVDVVVGTFGKAIGVSGAAVAGSKHVSTLLHSRARSLMYTTAPPPVLSAAILEGLRVLPSLSKRRQRLRDNIAYFRHLCRERNLPIMDSHTPIQPILIGDADKTMQASRELWRAGVFVQGIRPPTVPKGTSRLRITLSCDHSPQQLQQLVHALDSTRRY